MESKEEMKKVQLGNFVYRLSEDDGIISVSTTSGSWYVGYAPGSMAHALIYSALFANDGDTQDNKEAVTAVTTFINAVYCACNIVDSDFTIKTYENIDDYMKRKGLESENKIGEQQNQEDVKRMKKMYNMEKELE